MRMTSPQRQLCRVLGGDISRNIERLSYASRLTSRKLINTASTKSNPSGYIVANSEDLLKLFDADFGCLSIGEEAKLLGPLDNSQEVLAILDFVRRASFTNIEFSRDIAKDYPECSYPGGFSVVAGFLLIPLSAAGQDFFIFFRRGQIQNIHWAGNPYDKVIKENAQSKLDLEPRKSFKVYSETVVGMCRAWTDDQLETASVLCLVYGKFINVWRQKEVAMRSNQLTSLLLSNASHEVRTPLNAIVNYLEMALEGSLDGDTREALSKSYTASKALIHVINDLLDLTRAEAGKDLYMQDPFDLPAAIDEALSMHRDEAERREITFTQRCTSPNAPTTVLGDRARFKQVLANSKSISCDSRSSNRYQSSLMQSNTRTRAPLRSSGARCRFPTSNHWPISTRKATITSAPLWSIRASECRPVRWTCSSGSSRRWSRTIPNKPSRRVEPRWVLAWPWSLGSSGLWAANSASSPKKGLGRPSPWSCRSDYRATSPTQNCGGDPLRTAPDPENRARRTRAQ
jgi:light-regulated signal transduction histidine kinase (bacteriophytochrome)